VFWDYWRENGMADDVPVQELVAKLRSERTAFRVLERIRQFLQSRCEEDAGAT
jgi:hypothetical protein